MDDQREQQLCVLYGDLTCKMIKANSNSAYMYVPPTTPGNQLATVKQETAAPAKFSTVAPSSLSSHMGNPNLDMSFSQMHVRPHERNSVGFSSSTSFGRYDSLGRPDRARLRLNIPRSLEVLANSCDSISKCRSRSTANLQNGSLKKESVSRLKETFPCTRDEYSAPSRVEILSLISRSLLGSRKFVERWPEGRQRGDVQAERTNHAPQHFDARGGNSGWSRHLGASPAGEQNGHDRLIPDVTAITKAPASSGKLISREVRPSKRILLYEKTKSAQADSVPAKRPRQLPKRHILKKWSKDEDDRLEEGVKLYKLPNWKLIAKHVGSRSNKMCAQRWRYSLRPEIKLVTKGKWTKEEDDKLRQILSKHDCKNERTWDIASEAMGFTRNGIQCRERWKNFLDPSLRFGAWTADEDKCLMNLHGKYGKQWKKFTAVLTGRSAQRIRRRFTSLQKRASRNGLFLLEAEANNTPYMPRE